MIARIVLGIQAIYDFFARRLRQGEAPRPELSSGDSVMRRIDSQELVPVHVVAGRPHRHIPRDL